MSENPYQSPPVDLAPDELNENPFAQCPRCGGLTRPGFFPANRELSFLKLKQVRKFFYTIEGLSSGDWWENLFAIRATYYRSYVCRECDVYLVDFSEQLTRRQARAVADELLGG